MAFTYSRITLEPLWTVADAKVHLRITTTASDADVAQKLETAQEAVLAYLGPAADVEWTPTTAPKAVRHAIVLLTNYYYEERGDGDLGSRPVPDVWPILRSLLAMYRDPTVA